MSENAELITREEASKRLAISVSEFRRRQRLGEMKSAKKGPKGELLFRATDIEALNDRRLRQKAEYTLEQASQVFEMLKEGATPVDCVIKLKVAPEAVEALMHNYASLNSALYIPAEQLRTINAMDLDGPFPLKTADDLVEALQGISEPKCAECSKRKSVFCKTCVQEAIKQAKEKAASTDEV